MDFPSMLRGIVAFVGLPLIGIAAIFAWMGGKVSKLVMLLGCAVVALSVTFGDINVWKSIGQGVTAGIDGLKNLVA